MTIRGAAFIAGAYEHPGRILPNTSTAQIHVEAAIGALTDAGLQLTDVDGYFCSGDAPGGPIAMADHLGLAARHIDSTDLGGSTYVAEVSHAAQAIAAGKCTVALITMGGRPRSAGRRTPPSAGPAHPFEAPYGHSNPSSYALAARRHMHEFGTTAAQLAEVKVAAASHAQHNPSAFLQKPVTIEEVLGSPLVADPLRRMDCCVVTDGGGALVVVSPEVAAGLSRRTVKVLGAGEATKHTELGGIDLTHTGAVWSGPRAFAEAGVSHADIDYVSIYDSFTITVIMTLEDLGFCAKGYGGRFVTDGTLRSTGALPFNTDGGSLCNNHPANRGGMTRTIEAVRQLRGDATPVVQVPDCDIALVHGTGGWLGTRMGSATLILGQEDS
ncbi:acetyl-CoA acetyltransferase [Rhodococcus oxybenzonivorans]|uniref:Acetyl-CoA acetyltransferase n=1 Tax=Rhodococcus oxybenzonivorans TaxID=1990687 RepID=A0A2S2BZ81_9NOCA|nr:thiolase domain-containing protein [Rhodococcus oxybenzonivorans]AWK73912.1 acetyl-CoA acetyltransferase [Rhodococcus oxybenzonivorans]